MILGGLVYLGIKMVGLIKAARRVGINNMTDVQVVVRKVQGLEPRFRELEKKQAALAESMQKLQAEAAFLNFLKEELDRATGNLSSLKS